MNEPQDDLVEEERGPAPGAPSSSPTPTALDGWKWLHECGSDFLSKSPPRRRWLLTRGEGAGVLPLGKVGMLAGAGAAGKTMALAQLALAIAGGPAEDEDGKPAKWLDTFDVAEPGHVLLALGEEDIEEMQRRLFNAAAMLGMQRDDIARASKRLALLPLAGEDVAFLKIGADRNLERTNAFGLLQKKLELAGVEWKAVLLDPLSRFAGPDAEKDNSAATRFIETLETLTKSPGNPTVLVAHHTSQGARKEGSSDATGARGVTGLTDGVRWVAGLENGALASSVKLTCWKTNYSKTWDSVWLARDEKNSGALRPEKPEEKTAREEKAKKDEPPKPAALKAAIGAPVKKTDV